MVAYCEPCLNIYPTSCSTASVISHYADTHTGNWLWEEIRLELNFLWMWLGSYCTFIGLNELILL